jgi:hypothetical protein
MGEGVLLAGARAGDDQQRRFKRRAGGSELLRIECIEVWRFQSGSNPFGECLVR